MSKEEYRAIIDGRLVRRRTIIESDGDRLTAFCVQLELNHQPEVGADDDWQYLARFDHNPSSQTGHDIREEGLHTDVYRPHEADRVADGFPPVPVEFAPKYAENFFDENYLQICERYLDWCKEENPAWRASLPLSP